MPIKSLLKLEEITKNKNVLSIDYSEIDPAPIRQKEEEEFVVSETIIEAQEKANTILKNARIQADEILAKAQEQAESIKSQKIEYFDQMKLEIEQDKEKAMQQIEDDANRRQENFEQEKELALNKIEDSRDAVRKEIRDEISEVVKEETVAKIKEMYDPLIDQVHKILNVVIQRRNEMLVETQKEMAEIVMLIARKVVKTFADTDDNVVIKNIIEAMSKLKGREKFIIKVNVRQLAYIQEDINVIRQRLEKDASITVLDDTNVEPGGCIIETEFGEIDARISTQLAEIEKRVRESGLVRNVSV